MSTVNANIEFISNGTLVSQKGGKVFKTTKAEAANNVGDITINHITEFLEKIPAIKEVDKFNVTITIESTKKK